MIAAALVAAVSLAACGGGQTQAANEPSGKFPVSVDTATFPSTQKLAQQTHLVIAVRNAGTKPIPEDRWFESKSLPARLLIMLSGVIVAADNPSNKRFSLVVLAGLSAEATTQLPAVLTKKDQLSAEVLVVPHGGKTKALVLPAKELVFEFPEK